MNSQQFVLVPLVAITFFAILVTAAVLLRKRAQLHKRLMTLAMISVLGPPIARLIFVTNTVNTLPRYRSPCPPRVSPGAS